MPCYVSRKSQALIGGIFISADGVRHCIPDHWLSQIELLNDSTLLKLGYSFRTVEISGNDLDTIFDDAIVGKLGMVTVVVADSDIPAGSPCVTSIVHVPLADTPSASFGERFDE